MESNDSFLRPESTEINLHDVFWYILKNWIILLVCMAVFGAMLGLYKRSSQAKTVAASEESVAEYNALSDEAKAKIKAADIPKLVEKSTINSAFKKYLILGAFVGLILGAAVLAVYFVIMGYLPNSTAVRNRYQLPTFGILPNSKISGLNRKIMNKLTYRANLPWEEAVRLTAANLAMHLRASEELLLVGTVPKKTLDKIRKELLTVLDVHVETAGNLNNQASAVLALSRGAKVVCVEKVLKSKQVYVDFEMDTLAASKSHCIGFILVE